jgi:nucleotide-binding universal stress UspA family protein
VIRIAPSHTAQHRHGAARHAFAAPRVVAVYDAASAGANACWRAAMVAREWGATLHILHPQDRAQSAIQELAQGIRQRTGIEVAVQAVRGSMVESALVLSHDAALVVLAARRGQPLLEWALGTRAETLLRRGGAPVLVVRQPALASYRRVLVPVSVDGGGAPLIALAASLARGSMLEVLHAVSVADEGVLRDMGGAEPALRSYRQYREQRAHLALHQLISAAAAEQAGAVAHVEFGDALGVLLARQRACDAELLVLGQRQRGLLLDRLRPGVTRRVLARSAADVLVQPAQAVRAPSPAQDPPTLASIEPASLARRGMAAYTRSP